MDAALDGLYGRAKAPRVARAVARQCVWKRAGTQLLENHNIPHCPVDDAGGSRVIAPQAGGRDRLDVNVIVQMRFGCELRKDARYSTPGPRFSLRTCAGLSVVLVNHEMRSRGPFTAA